MRLAGQARGAPRPNKSSGKLECFETSISESGSTSNCAQRALNGIVLVLPSCGRTGVAIRKAKMC